MLRLGELYEGSAETQPDYPQAVLWYQKAYAAGSVEAATYLGLMYDSGRGVAPNPEQSVMWFSRGAERGSAEAMTNLGAHYFSGRGVPHDPTVAERWFRKAADLGFVNAMEKLGRMYESGLSVTKNLDEARRWYKKAAALDSSFAKFRLLTLGRAPFDLTGEWDGADSASFQRLRVSQSGTRLSAMRYVAADSTQGAKDYFRGAFGDDTFVVPVEVAQYREGLLVFDHHPTAADFAPTWNATVFPAQAG